MSAAVAVALLRSLLLVVADKEISQFILENTKTNQMAHYSTVYRS